MLLHVNTVKDSGRIQSKLEGGAVGNGGAEIFSKIGDESAHIQQFEVHFRNKQNNFEVILVANLLIGLRNFFI